MFSRPERVTTKKTHSSATSKNSTQSSAYTNIFSLHIVTEVFLSVFSNEKGKESMSVFYDNAGFTFYLFTSFPLAKPNLVFATHLKCKSVTQTCSQDRGSSVLHSEYSCPLSGSFAHRLPEQFKH